MGAAKMWAHLRRLGVPVARCTVERGGARERLARGEAGQEVRTTIVDPAAGRAPDLVKRHVTAECPDELWVADVTYVPMVSGFGCTALVINAFAGRIVGWECSLSKETAFVESAIRQAAACRARADHPLTGSTIHHLRRRPAVHRHTLR